MPNILKQDLKCPFCKSKEVEKFSDEHYMCKKCGIGSKGNEKIDVKSYLNSLKDLIIYFKKKNPKLNDEQLITTVQNYLHKEEGHPVDDRGFCHYCGKVKK